MKKILLVLLSLSIVSCNQKTEEITSLQGGGGTCSGDVAKSATSGPLFKVGDTVVSRSDLTKDIENYIYTNEQEAYEKNQAVLKELALRIHLAKEQGKYKDKNNVPPLTELIKYEKVSEAEAKAFYEQNKHRMQGAPFNGVKAQLLRYLEGQRISIAFKEKFAELEASGSYTNMIPAPVAPKVSFNLDGLPMMGDKSAKVQVVEVSDYLCGHCQKAHPQVKKILEKYKGKIGFTQVNFSLRPSGLSGTYIRGAYCAQQKGNDTFWKYHNAAFDKASEPHDHSVPGHSHGEDGSSKESLDKVISVAKKAGLNVEEFKKCLNSDAAKSNLAKVNNMVVNNGINGTPVFVVNNKKLAKGVFELEKAIEAALK